MFHKLKFPITKAFYLVYLTMKDKNITLEELSRTLSLRKETCWSFRQKIQQARKSYDESELQTGGIEGWEGLALISVNK